MVLSEWNSLRDSTVPAMTCQHRSDDFALIKGVFEVLQPKTVIELGTDAGGLAAFFADIVAPWGGLVYTYDIHRKFNPLLLGGAWPNIIFEEVDVLNNPGKVWARIAESEGPVLLYCDNGHKEKELELYAPWIEPGSVIGVHDFGTEVRPQFAYELLEDTHDMVPLCHEQFEALANEWYPHSLTRFWMKPVIKFDEDDETWGGEA